MVREASCCEVKLCEVEWRDVKSGEAMPGFAIGMLLSGQAESIPPRPKALQEG